MGVMDYRVCWDSKPVLRSIYKDFQKRIVAMCIEGRTLEIGGGAGNLKVEGELISTDIQWAPWLDIVADAQKLPFVDGAFDNIVMIDVLHHIECPRYFFQEVCRLLKTGGRIVMLEPAMTPVARFFYTYIHEEPVEMEIDPLVECETNPLRDPYDANQAIPSLLFGRYLNNFQMEFPDLKLIHKSYLSLFAYPLSGGFKHWSLIPVFMTKPMLFIESMLMPILGPIMAFRTLISIERK